LVFVLGAAGFGVVTSLSAAELVAIAGVAIGLAVALAAFGVMWRQYAEAAEEREREEVLARVVADAIELSRRRDEEIQQMKEEGKLYPE
jgi:putative ubiquitin-RnfH superfamily antitoxin RatB of RatAB toxin-antitoxin module